MVLSWAESQFELSTVGIFPCISKRPKCDGTPKFISSGCVGNVHSGSGNSIALITDFCAVTHVCVLESHSCKSCFFAVRFQTDRIAMQPATNPNHEIAAYDMGASTGEMKGAAENSIKFIKAKKRRLRIKQLFNLGRVPSSGSTTRRFSSLLPIVVPKSDSEPKRYSPCHRLPRRLI